MPEPHWTSYVGMITGVMGAGAGLVGAVLGYVGYRRSTRMKSLDLRLEYQKLRDRTHVSGVQLIELLDEALRSRNAVASAMGLLNSGAQQLFHQKHEADQASAAELIKAIPLPTVDVSSLNPTQLETEIVQLNRTLGWIMDMTTYYQKTMEQDDRDRAHIRDSVGKHR